eukprot:TRINITY_DN676_c1_g1_i1.p1 TRINITY_DN676_c1_g1~~TRINITY_DN676_c1_g1_i1.p1  ORF type:complete len:417 (-),score=87.29 TRINITY_DN676_c1_g1_i1:64-1314(-)
MQQQQQQYYYHQPAPALPVAAYYMQPMMPTANPHMHANSFNHNLYYMPHNQGRMKKSYSTNTPRRNYSMDGRYQNVQRSGSYDRPGRRDQYYNKHRRSKSRPNQGDAEQTELGANERVVAVNLSQPKTDGNNQSATAPVNQGRSSNGVNQDPKTDSIVFDESLGIVNETEFSGSYETTINRVDTQAATEKAQDADQSKSAVLDLPENLSLKDNEEESKDVDNATSDESAPSNPQSGGFLTETEESEEAEDEACVGAEGSQLEAERDSGETERVKESLSESELSTSWEENCGIESEVNAELASEIAQETEKLNPAQEGKYEEKSEVCNQQVCNYNSQESEQVADAQFDPVISIDKQEVNPQNEVQIELSDEQQQLNDDSVAGHEGVDASNDDSQVKELTESGVEKIRGSKREQREDN